MQKPIKFVYYKVHGCDSYVIVGTKIEKELFESSIVRSTNNLLIREQRKAFDE
jgi:hypothetical protein